MGKAGLGHRTVTTLPVLAGHLALFAVPATTEFGITKEGIRHATGFSEEVVSVEVEATVIPNGPTVRNTLLVSVGAGHMTSHTSGEVESEVFRPRRLGTSA